MLNLVANGPSGYNLTNSLRFRASASAYLSRTPASTGSRQTFTYSFWTKRGTLGTLQRFIAASDNVTGDFIIDWTTSNTLEIYDNGPAGTSLITTQVFRDPSAWYHIVIVYDTTNATTANRVRVYVNGTQVTAFGTAVYPAQNTNSFNNQASIPARIGIWPSGSQYFDGYFAEFNFIDGQALTPSSFGSTNALTGVWQPAKYTGTYGTNGFYLNFNSIALTSGSNTGLGKDNSGNGNYWNTNNISVTAGTTYDAMLDVPTLTSATVANYAVYDQLTPSKVSGSGVRSISAANLYVTNSGPNGWSAIGTTITMTSGSGKWYWEVTCSGTTSNGTMIGIHRPFTSTSTFPSEIIGYTGDTDGYGYYMGGNKYNNSGAGVAYGASYTAGDVIGVALDMSTAGSASITFYKNNTSQGVAFSSLTGDFFAAVSQAQANGLDINFGQRPFSYTPPTGYVALNTYNLPTPTILQGNKYMDATLYTGNSSTQSITNTAGFKPDLVWVKSRSAATDHKLTDSVRGVTKALISDTTGAETTDTNGLTAFNSNGWSLGTDTNYNNNTATYVGWQWQAGQGSTSTNTSGSVTSTVSVSTTAGFSVATWTAPASGNWTIGHGLGVAPSFVITKNKSSGGWIIYHSALGNTKWLEFTTAAAQTGTSFPFNSVSPSSSVITYGNATSWGASANFVTYSWAAIPGFSAFGSYTGNGSADGTFIYTGFRPKYVLIKASSAVYQWLVWDSVRTTYNIEGNYFLVDQSNAEAGFDALDFVSNGFKLRVNHPAVNTNGTTYIYACFAENPFRNSLAR